MSFSLLVSYPDVDVMDVLFNLFDLVPAAAEDDSPESLHPCDQALQHAKRTSNPNRSV